MITKDGTQGEGRLRIGYVLKKYPRLSETFILNEMLGLEELGHEVSVFSLYLPDEGRFHADAARLRADVQYLPHFKSDSVLTAFSLLREAGSPYTDHLDAVFSFLELLPERKRLIVLLQGLHLASEVRKRKIDHLHAHFMTGASWIACAAHLFCGVSFTVTAHAKDIYRDTVDADVFRKVAGEAARLVTVSDYNRSYINERYLPGDSSRVVRIYNGLPFDEFRNRVPESRERNLILGVGRLVEKKGFPTLLEACRILRDRGRPFRCVVIGEGEDGERLLEQRRKASLEDHVEFPGPLPREEVLSHMSRARVLAAPCQPASDGNRDALPTVLLEALAMGLPPVSTPVTGIPEIVDHDANGLIVPDRDPEALADALERLLLEDSLWQRFSSQGPITVEARFDRKTTIPILAEVFGASRLVTAGGGEPS